jgi:hypothetical protein
VWFCSVNARPSWPSLSPSAKGAWDGGVGRDTAQGFLKHWRNQWGFGVARLDSGDHKSISKCAPFASETHHSTVFGASAPWLANKHRIPKKITARPPTPTHAKKIVHVASNPHHGFSLLVRVSDQQQPHTSLVPMRRNGAKPRQGQWYSIRSGGAHFSSSIDGGNPTKVTWEKTSRIMKGALGQTPGKTASPRVGMGLGGFKWLFLTVHCKKWTPLGAQRERCNNRVSTLPWA